MLLFPDIASKADENYKLTVLQRSLQDHASRWFTLLADKPSIDAGFLSIQKRPPVEGVNTVEVYLPLDVHP